MAPFFVAPEIQTLPQSFLKRCQASPEFICYKNYSKNPARDQKDITFSEVYSQAQNAGLGLRRLGAQKGERVVILSHSRYEWILADLAIQSVHAISVPIDPELSIDEIILILKDCQPTYIISDTNRHLVDFPKIMAAVTSIKNVIFFESIGLAALPRDFLYKNTDTFLAWGGLQELGRRELDRNLFDESLQAIAPSDTFSISYTSGTTGNPKGVTLTHEGIASSLSGCIARLGSEIQAECETTFCILPYSHIFGRIEAYTPFVCGWTECFTDSKSLWMEHFLKAEPTVFFTVPQVLERLASIAKDQTQSLSRAKKLLLKAMQITGQSKRLLGLGGKLHLIISGSAPLEPEVKAFLKGHSILVLEGYGLTETSGPVTLEDPKSSMPGKVGAPLQGVELKLTEDSEIWVRSRQNFKEYFKNQTDTENTHSEGWFKTGDLGLMDQKGVVQILGRKKDLIITSSGRRISPLKLEAQLQTIPLIQHALILGEGKPSPMALITLNSEKLKLLAHENHLIYSSLEEFHRHPVVTAHLKKALENINELNAPFERIAQFTVLPRPFSVEEGELTPSMKIRRAEILKNFASEVNAMYQT